MTDNLVEMPVTQRAFDWVDGVLSGAIPSGKRIIQACQRFRTDLSRAGTDAFPYVFDAEASEHMCAFMETLPHIEGAWAAQGETIELLGWQAFLISQIGGWRHMVSGLRRFRTAYVEVPRKNGKSTLLAGVGLYFLGADGEPGAKVYSAAASTHQARIVFDAARVMALTGEFEGTGLDALLGLTIEEHKIKTPDPAAVFQPIASQTKSKDGKNPHCAIVDELHEHEKRDVWDSMASALGAREHPLLIAITTAGYNTAGICYEQRKYVQSLLDGARANERYLGLIFEADEGDEPGDPKTWEKANPSLYSAKSLEYMQDEWEKATASPAAMGEFLRKHLDIWTSVGAAALDMDAWRASEDPGLQLADFAGCKAYLGVDLATRRDPASVTLVIPDEGDPAKGPLKVFSWHFLPEKLVEAPGNEHLWGWAKDGFIRTTQGAELDLRIVEALVLQLAGLGDDSWGWGHLPALDIEMVIYDALFAAQMAAAWEAAGMTAVELRSRASNLNEPFNKLIAAVDDHRLINDGNPVLTWMAGNTLLKQVQGGDYIYPAKLVPEDKIDGIVALINALWPLSQVPEDTGNDDRRNSFFQALGMPQGA
ncbi:terminase TerL endonuclease subunit [Pseudophaeobacter sp. 1A16562]|uniref:terminase large subunit n=1 Tax=Pseudophaeobacter sp. 1A16562 TaxID=3098143 RepID=UPI0034D6EF40